MSEPQPGRLDMELELLVAMYPDQISYSPEARELKFTQEGATLQLRLPDTYPDSGWPDIIAAIDADKTDLRAKTKVAINDLNLSDGEEVLDTFMAAFQQVLEEHCAAQRSTSLNTPDSPSESKPSKTVIIWLHHLLATTKRKLAISTTAISGITKPGYPGIMIFSGPTAAVTEHVNTLKAENWQAFQVRYDDERLWIFAHGKGVKEVETMAEVVKHVDCESGKPGLQEQKEEFLQAVGIR
ncbi:hypothetical protein EK21DRAFT_56625 [Setomelanomma holmii]|uniref:RWD domain-containing protein n=1 Tax=Setomelanomma holmii TaxID=210430 RepID=A0A9P4HJ66_9PLEO|nr:hypothetical protein EK21DRAFT_56625 [Setomelanomma holmii]